MQSAGKIQRCLSAELDENTIGVFFVDNIQDIFITNGASEAIELCLTGLVNEGENVLILMPGYPLYTAILAKIGAVENPYYLDENNGWQPYLNDIAAKINDNDNAKIIPFFIHSPC